MAFFSLVFVVVLACLTIMQLAGLEPYAGFVVGFVAALMAMLGGLLVFKPHKQT